MGTQTKHASPGSRRAQISGRSQRGHTLVHVVIAATLLVGILGMSGRVMLTMSRTTDVTITRSQLETEAHRVLSRISTELMPADRESIVPTPFPSWTSTISFRKATDIQNGDALWSPEYRIALEADPGELVDGLDNDGDGLVDEAQIVLTRDVGTATETRVVLTQRAASRLAGESFDGLDENGNDLVDEEGLCFEMTADLVIIRLTLLGRDGARRSFSKTVESAVRLRNSRSR